MKDDKGERDVREHAWDRDGERCINCGQKDWMRGSECRPNPETRPARDREDMVLVPREPTAEMLVAWQNADGLIKAYYAMLAAAPVASQMGETVADMTYAEYAADPYWKATEAIIHEISEHHERGIKWPCSECSKEVQAILRDWFSSPTAGMDADGKSK